MKHLCLWLIRFYRKRISPLKKPCCRFTPSCSAYALEAFSKRGFFVGFALTVWRILRCNPYCAGGYDPVPEKGFFYRGSREIPTECCRDSSDTTVSQGEAGEDASSPEASLHGKDNHL